MAGPPPPSATAALTKQRFLRKHIRHTRKAVGSSGSVSSLDYISEDEESEYNDDLDKNLAYAVHVEPTAPLGNEAALQALCTEDTDNEGIQGNLALSGENGPTEGTDGRRNGTSAGGAGNSLDKKTPPRNHHSPSRQIIGSTSHAPPPFEDGPPEFTG
jgi:hypothetical protein